MGRSEPYEHEHEVVEGAAYDAATAAYRAALRGTRKRDQAAHDAAYVHAVAEMERAHGRVSEEALAALFHLARFRNLVRDWLVVLDRESERFGPRSEAGTGTLSWMADAFDGSDPRSRALYRWALATSRARTGHPDAGMVMQLTQACAVNGWTPLLAAEACVLVSDAVKHAPAEALGELATSTAAELEDGTEWPTAFDMLGRTAAAAELLETLAASAGASADARAPLRKAAKQRRAMKARPAAAKGHPLLAARKLIEADKPFVLVQAGALLASIPAEPAWLHAPATRLALELSVALGDDGAEARLAALDVPWATTLRAFDRLLRGRAEEAAALLAGASPRLAEHDDPQRWEALHAGDAARAQWGSLDAWLDELRVEHGLAMTPAPEALAVKRSVQGSPDGARAALLHELYGIDLPDDLHALFEVARALSPEAPLDAFDPLELALVGPFEVLAGRLDARRPARSMLLHWRYSYHPPEYLPILRTAEDSITYGYWFDDWTPGGVDRRFGVDSEAWAPVGRTAADLIRFEIERAHAGLLDEYADASARRGALRAAKEAVPFFDRARALLLRAGATNDGRVGEAYLDGLRLVARVARARVRAGADAPRDLQIGVGCDPRTEKPAITAFTGDAAARELGAVALARQDGWQALACGGHLWRRGGEKHAEEAFRLLDGAYALLGREGVRRVLRVHHADRWLPSVDLLGD